MGDDKWRSMYLSFYNKSHVFIYNISGYFDSVTSPPIRVDQIQQPLQPEEEAETEESSWNTLFLSFHNRSHAAIHDVDGGLEGMDFDKINVEPVTTFDLDSDSVTQSYYDNENNKGFVDKLLNLVFSTTASTIKTDGDSDKPTLKSIDEINTPKDDNAFTTNVTNTVAETVKTLINVDIDDFTIPSWLTDPVTKPSNLAIYKDTEGIGVTNGTINVEHETVRNLTDCIMPQSVTFSQAAYFYLVPVIVFIALILNGLAFRVFRNNDFSSHGHTIYYTALSIVDTLFLFGNLLGPWLGVLLERMDHQSGNIYHQSSAMCKGMAYFINVTLFLSSSLMVSMTIDRYILVGYPFRHKRYCNIRSTQRVTVYLTCVSILLNCYILFVWDSTEISEVSGKICAPKTPSLVATVMTLTVNLIVLFVVPIIGIIYMNLSIGKNLPLLKKNATKLRAICKAVLETKLTKTTLMLTGFYGILTAPYLIAWAILFIQLFLEDTNVCHFKGSIAMRDMVEVLFLLNFAFKFLVCFLSGRGMRGMILKKVTWEHLLLSFFSCGSGNSGSSASSVDSTTSSCPSSSSSSDKTIMSTISSNLYGPDDVRMSMTSLCSTRPAKDPGYMTTPCKENPAFEADDPRHRTNKSNKSRYSKNGTRRSQQSTVSNVCDTFSPAYLDNDGRYHIDHDDTYTDCDFRSELESSLRGMDGKLKKELKKGTYCRQDIEEDIAEEPAREDHDPSTRRAHNDLRKATGGRHPEDVYKDINKSLKDQVDKRLGRDEQSPRYSRREPHGDYDESPRRYRSKDHGQKSKQQLSERSRERERQKLREQQWEKSRDHQGHRSSRASENSNGTCVDSPGYETKQLQVRKQQYGGNSQKSPEKSPRGRKQEKHRFDDESPKWQSPRNFQSKPRCNLNRADGTRGIEEDIEEETDFHTKSHVPKLKSRHNRDKSLQEEIELSLLKMNNRKSQHYTGNEDPESSLRAMKRQQRQNITQDGPHKGHTSGSESNAERQRQILRNKYEDNPFENVPPTLKNKPRGATNRDMLY
ncbi:unnamed protein product [Owenia fusiformis]|uniref:Uncharacterized protein n=1 Tax=Owenia fusiformis TaxID=6347 RepID=A0A8J1XUY1_OWEFU|nr:unnamed protein product [Owenia fusiformis]